MRTKACEAGPVHPLLFLHLMRKKRFCSDLTELFFLLLHRWFALSWNMLKMGHCTIVSLLLILLQSTLSNSNSLGDRKSIPVTKGSNYKDSNYRGFRLEVFKGCDNLFEFAEARITRVRIRQS